jgi:iron complex transport system substrate-binding protein
LKKILSLVLVSIMLVVVLSACGEKDNNKGSAASPSASPSAVESASPSASPSASAAAPTEVTITHALGTATLKTNPAKVVVFDYATLDSLDKLGVEIAAVPQASLPEYLSKYRDSKYVDGGTLFEPDFEKINKLKPDVILIGGRTAEAYAELNKIAPTIQMSLDNSKYSESFETNANILGQIFAKETEVNNELSVVNAAIEELKGKATASGKALVVLTTGGKISAYGPGSRFGVIHDVFGFTPADDKIEASTHGQSVTSEYIVEKNPDILFVIDRDTVTSAEGAAPAQAIIENDLVKKTNAYKNGKIIYLDASYWYLSGGGLISTVEMVKEASKAVQ